MSDEKVMWPGKAFDADGLSGPVPQFLVDLRLLEDKLVTSCLTKTKSRLARCAMFAVSPVSRLSMPRTA